MHTDTFTFTPIGTIHSPYRDKFAVPRQPGLVTAATAELHLLGDANREEILRGIEEFSHLWLTFVFHRVADQGWKPTVRPPRLGGNEKLGVFATRSPYRPNAIGLSVVELIGIEKRNKQWLLILQGADLVDGTPVLDIKPYISYADAIPDARCGFADTTPPLQPVYFSDSALTALELYAQRYPTLQTLIEQVLAQQPQPAYHPLTANPRLYGMHLYELNIQWQLQQESIFVVAITPIAAM